MRKVLTALFFALGAGVLVVGCGGSTPTQPTTTTTTTVPTFTVTVSASTPVAFYSMFDSTGSTSTLSAQRSPAGALLGGWNSPVSIATLQQNGTTATATPVGAGDATITYADSTGPSGSAVLRSAPRFDAAIRFGGNYVVGSCVDTTPPGTTTVLSSGLSICNTAGMGTGQGSYSFNLASTAGTPATPVVINLTGSFFDSIFPSLTRSFLPTTIAPAGTFVASASTPAVIVRPVPAPSVSVTVSDTWTVNAAAKDGFTGTSTATIVPSGNNCGAGTTACSGSVIITRTIQTVQKQ
ncbi:MAG: hypothetical protein ABL971_04465 [Vicinamibacterales bacterium]